jgi:toxin ParE1/3/4
VVNWSQTAKADLVHIHKYIAEDSLHYALKVITSIVSKTDPLATLPHMGRVVPEIMDETIREIISDPYRIIYSTKSSPVTILTVIHAKRDLNKAVKEKISNAEKEN